ncbi:hypothetical protein [Nonomuraea sediminis]|nr:hypothetical protein [Nonomuraea sediminis]
MATTVLLLGLKGVVVDEARAHLDLPDLEILSGTGIDDVRDAGPRAGLAG